VAGFQIDALPDAADGAVPTLFAVRYLGKRDVGRKRLVVARINDAHHQFVRACETERAVQLQLER
jgi:hypothetical protein